MSLTSTVLSDTHNTLTHLNQLLKDFTHRNNNQHRSTHWFSSLSILRRSLKRTESDLLDIPHHGGAWKSNPKHDQRLMRRARWLRDVVLPRCYVVFTQLIADNQHAALGLMLVTVLATTRSTVDNILPSDESIQSTHLPSVPSESSAAAKIPPHLGCTNTNKDAAVPLSVKSSEPASLQEDKGVAVSRRQPNAAQDMALAAAAHHKTRLTQNLSRDQQESCEGAPAPATAARTLPTSRCDKRRQSSSGRKERSNLGVSDDAANDSRSSKKKKKKKQKGDEFASLFGSLT